MCSFATGNLADTQTWPAGSFDVVFCRNVFIYFSSTDIARTVTNMKNRLSEMGTLFLGLTESINGVTNVLTAIGPSIYGRDAEWVAKPEVKARAKVDVVTGPTTTPSASLKVMPPVERRVLCVDDSPIVLKLLGEIFTKGSGFVVADSASNGKIAADLLVKNKYDLITLDIHMPQMTGLEFMQKAYRPEFPPVIVVSSVDRTDNSLALEMMRLGAKDYVQKPALKDFERYKDEFLLKANAVCQYSKRVTGASADQLFARSGNDVAKGRVGLYFREKDWRRALDFIQSNSHSGMSFEIVYIEEPSSDKTWLDRFTNLGKRLATVHRQKDHNGALFLPKMDVAVVLSNLSPQQLNALRFMKSATYLAEEAYPRADNSILDSFDMFPSASLAYVVKKSLIETHKKGA
jgi:chemotaxis protein methyltransferase CheR